MVLQELDAFCARLSATPGGPEPSAVQKPAVLRQVRTFLPRLLVTVIFLALLSMGNRTPLGHTSPDGVLRLAWRLSGEKIRTCRDLTAAELAAKPLHMRQPRECREQPLHYRLVLTIDGATHLDKTVTPAGARGDRPLYVHEDIPLPGGAYVIDVAFTPLAPEIPQLLAEADASARQPRHLVLHAQAKIVPNQIILIDYDDQTNTLAIVDKDR